MYGNIFFMNHNAYIIIPIKPNVSKIDPENYNFFFVVYSNLSSDDVESKTIPDINPNIPNIPKICDINAFYSYDILPIFLRDFNAG